MHNHLLPRSATSLLSLAMLCVASLTIQPCAAADPPTNHLFSELTDKGVAIGGQQYKLPAVTMADGLASDAQQAQLKTIADDRHPVESLVRKSVVAPFSLKVNTLKGSDDQPSTARAVDLWFVAYGDIEKITSDGVLEFLQDVRGGEKEKEPADDDDAVFLNDEEIAERKLTASGVDPKSERYFFNTFELLDRVRLRATRQAVVTASVKSVLVAIHFDPRFDADPKRPNTWQPLSRNELGQMVAGDPLTYSATGSYLKITPLAEPPQALFVEYHLIFDEPPGWFRGANLLRSKLPVMIEDIVRKARRRLSKTLPE